MNGGRCQSHIYTKSRQECVRRDKFDFFTSQYQPQNLTSRIFKSIKDKEVAVGCIVGIKGTFNNTIFDYIGSAALKKKIDQKISKQPVL